VAQNRASFAVGTHLLPTYGSWAPVAGEAGGTRRQVFPGNRPPSRADVASALGHKRASRALSEDRETCKVQL
jgi:hypothetical protein